MRYCKRQIFWIIFLTLVGKFLYAQTNQEKEQFGDAAYSEGDYYSASVYYETLLSVDTSNINLMYKYAEACRMFNDYLNAENSYQKVVKSEKSSTFPLALFWLGWMKKSNGKYNEAEAIFKEYYNLHSGDNDYYSKKALNETEACKKAVNMMKDTVDVLISHLGENINSIYSEFAPVELDNNTLLYSTLRPFNDDETVFLFSNVYLSKVYIVKKADYGWQQAVEMNHVLNDPKFNNANTSVTQDGKRIYFTRCNFEKLSDLKCNIFVTEKLYGKWKKPEKLSDNINLSGYSSTQPAISRIDSSGLEILYFSSNRPGGLGKYDIWYSIINNGKYSDPVNLGSFINSPGDEISPFYDNKKGVLYFISDWHKGFGGYDIFSSKGALNYWTAPKNLGYPLNTSYNDIYFSVNRSDTNGFFVSNRPGSYFIKGETCCNDIYSYEWLQPEPVPEKKPLMKDSIVIAKDTTKFTHEDVVKNMLPISLYFHNDIPGPDSWDTLVDMNYLTTFNDYMKLKNVYIDEYSKGLSGDEKVVAKNDISDFFENYVRKGYDDLELFSSWLLAELDKGKVLNIVIKGYCSPKTTSKYNFNLSKRRISSIVNYFIAYRNGAMSPYINGNAPNGGRLNITSEPLGESTAGKYVSDNPADTRLSVFSRAAALERKIQIILNESKTIKTPAADIAFTERNHDFGNIIKGEIKTYSFVFKNTGKIPLKIISVETDCGCVTTDFPFQYLSSGSEGKIRVTFNSNTESGEKSVRISVYTNASLQKIDLIVSASVGKLTEENNPLKMKK